MMSAAFSASMIVGAFRLPLTIRGITEAALKRLVEYDWPGNVRELQTLIERLVVLKQSGWIDEPDIPPPLSEKRTSLPKISLPAEGIDFSAYMEGNARDVIRQALDATGWNKNRAAKLLGLKRTTLVEKIRTLGIEPDEDDTSA